MSVPSLKAVAGAGSSKWQSELWTYLFLTLNGCARGAEMGSSQRLSYFIQQIALFKIGCYGRLTLDDIVARLSCNATSTDSWWRRAMRHDIEGRDIAVRQQQAPSARFFEDKAAKAEGSRTLLRHSVFLKGSLELARRIRNAAVAAEEEAEGAAKTTAPTLGATDPPWVRRQETDTLSPRDYEAMACRWQRGGGVVPPVRRGTMMPWWRVCTP